MKKMLMILAVLTIAGPAMAADIFNKPVKDNVLPDAPSAQQQTAPAAPATPPPSAPAPQAAAPEAPQAPAETVEEFAKRYNENCLKKEHPVLKGEPLRMLCACSAQKLQEKMTVDEVKAMMTDTPEGLAQRNRMAVHVYGPCMEHPVRALLHAECMKNNEVMSKYKNGPQLCTCTSDNMANYIATHGPAIMAQVLTANPNELDPLGGLMNSQGFQAQTQQAFVACVGQFPITP
jgi:hypothetical protein